MKYLTIFSIVAVSVAKNAAMGSGLVGLGKDHDLGPEAKEDLIRSLPTFTDQDGVVDYSRGGNRSIRRILASKVRALQHGTSSDVGKKLGNSSMVTKVVFFSYLALRPITIPLKYEIANFFFSQSTAKSLTLKWFVLSSILNFFIEPYGAIFALKYAKGLQYKIVAVVSLVHTLNDLVTKTRQLLVPDHFFGEYVFYVTDYITTTKVGNIVLIAINCIVYIFVFLIPVLEYFGVA